MNKKYLMFGIVGLFAMVLVTAAVMEFYGQVEQTLDVENPITVVGDGLEFFDCYSGDSCNGEVIEISNAALTERKVKVTNDANDNEIVVSYIQGLGLTKKDGNWNPIIGEEISLNFVMIGDKFNAEVIEEDVKGGYVLIYYKDNSDRFISPAKAILIEDVEGNLPYEDDKNADEYEYCENVEGDEYLNCHGAKIWYVPSDAINPDATLQWNRMSEFYFETDLIEYNIDGEITIYPNVINPLTPVYTLNPLLVDGKYTVTTTVNPVL